MPATTGHRGGGTLLNKNGSTVQLATARHPNLDISVNSNKNSNRLRVMNQRNPRSSYVLFLMFGLRKAGSWSSTRSGL
jgi:hypothetical protein